MISSGVSIKEIFGVLSNALKVALAKSLNDLAFPVPKL